MQALRRIGDALKRFRFLRFLLKLGFYWLFFIAALIFGVIAYVLQQSAFLNSASASGQISATVYVRAINARAILKSTVYPAAPQDDKLAVNVSGPGGARDPWLLVVQCPPEPGLVLSPQVPMFSESTSGTQKIGTVAVSVHDKTHWHGLLGCYVTPQGQQGQQAPVLKGQSFDLTLPVLQQNPLAQSAQADTPLYVERRTSGQAGIADLVEVIQAPGSICPEAPPPVGRLQAAPSPGSAAPTAPAPASASPALGSASPSPPAASAVCYSAKARGTRPAKYFFPLSVATTETLADVNLSNDRIDSIFPSGQVTSDQVYWQGASGLSPALSATSLSSAADASKATFFAGVLYGLAAGFIVPFIQRFPEDWKAVKDKPDEPRHSDPSAEVVTSDAV